MIKKTFIGLLLLIINIGCVGSPSYPDWFNQTKSDTAQYSYGTKSGTTKEEAVSNALNEIASKIKVSVESTSTIHTQRKVENNEEEYNKESTRTISNHVEKIEFSNYKVKKEKKISDDKYVVLVEVDKALNAKLLLKKIDTNIAQYNQLLSAEHKNPIATVKKYNKAIKQINDKDLINCSIVQNFAPNSSVDDYISKLLTIKKTMEKYQSNIVFSIEGNDKAYQNTLVEQIASKGFRTTEGSSNITISVDVMEKKLKLLGNNILKATIQLTVKSNGTTIGKSRLIVGAKSRTSYQQAKNFTLKNFEKRLANEEVIENLLGI
jgi:hypothetical protein